jgi:hypothetical protein
MAIKFTPKWAVRYDSDAVEKSYDAAVDTAIRSSRAWRDDGGATFSYFAAFWMPIQIRRKWRFHETQTFTVRAGRVRDRTPNDRTEAYTELMLAAWDLLRFLPPRTAEMVKMRAGGAYLEEIGRRFGITTEYARMLVNPAFVKLKKHLLASDV